MTTVGEGLVRLLEAHGVDTVFGIPGMHTVELYRGLAASPIRHVTPRHEQGAGFMADGYARVSGRPGVALVITGPGLTNTITAMAQARADSVPMLVVSGVNPAATLGRGLGWLHELPDQRGMMEKVALASFRIDTARDLPAVFGEAFRLCAASRPGPVHIEIPTDVMGHGAPALPPPAAPAAAPAPDPALVAEAARLLASSSSPLILAGGGARRAETELRRLAELLDAPVVLTANGRGLLFGHGLAVPASPSLKAVRGLVAAADLVIAAGTELGPTDYDMYDDGGFVLPGRLVRIDVDAAQLARRPATVAVRADCRAALSALADRCAGKAGDGAARAASALQAALDEIGPAMRAQVAVIETIRDALPGSIVVGDSTQPVYAANLCYGHDRPGGWFNAATGYGALGYGLPAAIGAALAAPPGTPVVCFAGDGGFQLTLPELATAVDAATPVITVVWNNSGYREIEVLMRQAGVEPVGVSPAPPDFHRLAEAYGVPSERLASPAGLGDALKRAGAAGGPRLIELMAD